MILFAILMQLLQIKPKKKYAPPEEKYSFIKNRLKK